MSRVQAIRVSCSGEASKRHKIKELCTYNLPDTHDIFAQGQLSQLSNLVGIPLLVLKMRPSMLQQPEQHYAGCWKRSQHGYSYKDHEDYFPNPIANALMAGNVNAQYDWSDKIGSVLLARSDKKPLEMSHIHLLLGLLNEATHIANSKSVTKAMEMLTPASFKQYYEATADWFKKQNPGEEWSERTPWDEEPVAVLPMEEDDEDEVL